MLETLFAQFGVLEDVYLPLPAENDGRASNRGFGFVTFAAPAAAQTAQELLHNSTEPTFKRRLIVQSANERPTE
jgi:RNA recognition motif-containing protein